MRIELADNPVAALADYANISTAFQVSTVMGVAVPADGSSGFLLSERSLVVPYVKDYDAIEGGGPRQWARSFDVANWGLLTAHEKGQVLGGAAVALNIPSLAMLDGRSDVAVLWDLRVRPEGRRKGIGSALFRAVETWARSHRCRALTIETQNINVPACRFYARQGCELRSVHTSAYLALPEEVQLIWWKDLRGTD